MFCSSVTTESCVNETRVNLVHFFLYLVEVFILSVHYVIGFDLYGPTLQNLEIKIMSSVKVNMIQE